MGKLIKQLGAIEKHLNKEDILNLAKDNAQAIVDAGHYDILTVYVELKRYETYLKGLIQHLKQPALEKATAEGPKTFDYNDAKVNISKRTKWDYSVDDEWSSLDDQIQQLTAKKKEREKYLKEINGIDAGVDHETGEINEGFKLPKEIEYGLTVRL